MRTWPVSSGMKCLLWGFDIKPDFVENLANEF